MTGVVLIGSLFVFVFLGFPIAIALGLSCCLYVAMFGGGGMALIVESFLNGTNSFTLLAIPFFMLSGELMISGGISQRLINFCMSLVKNRPGGLAIVTIISSMFFAAISGSGPATVACIGGIMIPQMVRAGYSKEFATAAAAAGGALGPIIPPSILFLLYGVATNTSVAKLFLAGVIPGILMGVAMIIIATKISKKEKYIPNEAVQAELQAIYDKGLFHNFQEAIWALLVPIIILGGIYSGIFSPTEAAIVASVYALFAGMFIYKELSFRDLPGVFIRAARGCSFLVIISFSTAFAKLLTLEGVTTSIANGVLALTTNKYIILIMINILLLIVGMIMDAAPATIILSPILLSIVQPLGVDPIQLGVIIVMNLAIGMITPPVGINLFVGCKISKIQLESTLKFALQLLVYMLVILILVTYVPAISLFLPNLL
ncbi:MAG: TRAP transporter large permease [Lachnospiraceae bacterium]|jgi:C4-dicarboxylate transporter DctM subunit|nr:TRAP transporter large permease [Lachnospiraceae bacterium]